MQRITLTNKVLREIADKHGVKNEWSKNKGLIVPNVIFPNDDKELKDAMTQWWKNKGADYPPIPYDCGCSGLEIYGLVYLRHSLRTVMYLNVEPKAKNLKGAYKDISDCLSAKALKKVTDKQILCVHPIRDCCEIPVGYRRMFVTKEI